MTRFGQDSELKKIFLSIHKREFELNLPHATENWDKQNMLNCNSKKCNIQPHSMKSSVLPP